MSEACAETVAAAEDPTGRLENPVAIAGEKAIDKETHFADMAHAAAKAAGARRLVPQLIALDAQRIVQFDFFTRHIARIGHQIVDGVESILGGARAVAAFVHFDADPILVARRIEARI